jgi:hypothetical protein
MKQLNFIIMTKTIILDEQQLSRLRSGKRLTVSLFMEHNCDENESIGYYVHGSNPRKRPREQTLMRLDHGTIRKSARKYKLDIGFSDDLGELHVGELMEASGKEAHSFMQHLYNILNN